MTRQFLVEIDTSEAVTSLSDMNLAEWIRETVADGIGPAYLDEAAVKVSETGRCAYCGALMETMVRGHHHTENGVDVTRDRRCITRANGHGPRCTRRAGHPGDHRTYKGETW